MTVRKRVLQTWRHVATTGGDTRHAERTAERVVRLVARHHEPPEAEDERLLARADREALP